MSSLMILTFSTTVSSENNALGQSGENTDDDVATVGPNIVFGTNPVRCLRDQIVIGGQYEATNYREINRLIDRIDTTSDSYIGAATAYADSTSSVGLRAFANCLALEQ